MKTAFFMIALFAVVCTVAIAQPKIEAIPGTTLDLGDYYRGQKPEQLITLKNVGTDTLRISEVKAQCGCTATLLSKKVLGPSQEGELKITFDTHSYSGKVTKQVYVSSNDSTTPKLTISFTTNVLEVLTINPGYFAFDQAKLDSTYTKTLTITNPSQKQAVKITSIKSPSDQIKVTLMKNELMPGEQTQLQATFHAAKSGTDNGVIELTTDQALQPKFEVRFYAWVNRK
jgi:hypothetical protein